MLRRAASASRSRASHDTLGRASDAGVARGRPRSRHGHHVQVRSAILRTSVSSTPRPRPRPRPRSLSSPAAPLARLGSAAPRSGCQHRAGAQRSLLAPSQRSPLPRRRICFENTDALPSSAHATMPCCGSHLCASCDQLWFATESTCPSCRAPVCRPGGRCLRAPASTHHAKRHPTTRATRNARHPTTRATRTLRDGRDGRARGAGAARRRRAVVDVVVAGGRAASRRRARGGERRAATPTPRRRSRVDRRPRSKSIGREGRYASRRPRPPRPPRRPRLGRGARRLERDVFAWRFANDASTVAPSRRDR